ncbi:MAG: glycosyltransferase family 2 protein, partial [Limisphaerales bacterium]
LYTVKALIAGFRFYGDTQRSQKFTEQYINECYAAIDKEKQAGWPVMEFAPTPPDENPSLSQAAPPVLNYPLSKTQIHRRSDEWPKISIITPSFHRVQFLEECIESVLSQNYPNLEYIIMDGGSTDGSLDIIKKYAKHLFYWQSKPDGGQYQAIDDGFKKTTGEIMAWLNADDKLYPEALEEVAFIFSQYRHVQWIMGRPNGLDEAGRQSWIVDYLPAWSREKYLKKKYRDPYIQQEGIFWRRALWEKAGARLDVNLLYAGDLELWARFFRHAQLNVVDALLAGFRSHEKQKSRRALQQYIAEAEKILDREIALFEQSEDKTLLPAPPAIQTGQVDPVLAKERKLSHDLLRWAEKTEMLLAEEKAALQYLKNHWWLRIGRNLGIISFSRQRKAAAKRQGTTT